MKIEADVPQWEIEETLNTEPPSPACYAGFLQALLNGAYPDSTPYPIHLDQWLKRAEGEVRNRHTGFVLNYLARALTVVLPKPPAGQGWRLPETITRDKAYYQLRQALVSCRLREFVDAWLDTGRSSDGESPDKRDLRNALHAWLAVEEYYNASPPLFLYTKERPGFRFAAARGVGSGLQATDFFESMAVKAKELFAQMIVADWSDRLCKCRYPLCGRYFFLAKPISRPQKSGLFCSMVHRRHATAARCTTEKRRRCHAKLIEYVATELNRRKKGSEWKDDNEVKSSVASRLSKYLQLECRDAQLTRYRPMVQKHWLTRNWHAIEKCRVKMASRP